MNEGSTIERESAQNGQVPLLEKGASRKRRKIGLTSLSSVVVVSLGFVGMIEYSLVMPSMNEFVVKKLHSTDLVYGLSMASFSLARLIFMPVLGIWSDRRPMAEPFLFSICLGILGNALYGCAEWAGTVWFVVIGRALVGMGAANSTLSMSYITRITDSESRTKALTTLNGINLLGIVLGPATNLLIDFRWEVPKGNPFHGLVFDKYTNPGWTMFAILFVIAGLLLVSFEEPPRIIHHTEEVDEEEEEEDSMTLHNNDNDSTSTANISSCLVANDLENPLMDAPESIFPSWKAVFFKLFLQEGIWIHFLISFCSAFIFTELETVLPKLTNVFFGWTTLENSFMYAIIGIATAITLLGTGTLSRVYSDRRFITIGTGLYGVGLVLGCLFLTRSPPFWLFATNMLFLIMAAPMTDSPNLAFYSKKLQAEKDAIPFLGLYIGFIQATNAVARTAAPLYAGWSLMTDNDSYLPVYLGPAIVWLISAFGITYKYKNLEKTKPPVLRRPPSIASFTSFEGLAQSPMLTPIM